MKELLLISLIFLSSQLFAQSKSPIIIGIDPRLELFTITEYLNGSIVFAIPSSYETEVKKYFKKFTKHPAVKNINHLLPGDLIESVYPMLSFHYTWPELNQETKIDYEALNKLHNSSLTSQKMEEQIVLLKQFISESGFKQFINNNKGNSDTWALPVIKIITDNQLTDRLGDFFGYHKQHLICLSPLMSWGGQAFYPNETFVMTKAVYRISYNTYKKEYVGKNSPPFFNDRNMIFDLIWHEGGHTYINPIVDLNYSLFDKSFFTEEYNQRLQKAGPWRWSHKEFVNEQLVRATVAFLLAKYEGKEAGQKEIDKQFSNGFIHTSELVELLNRYDLERSRYQTFEEYFPEIITFFNSK